MSQKQYLDYEGLVELVNVIKAKYAGIEAFAFKGVVADIAHLPSIANQKSGYVYNVTTGGETTADFVEGAGKTLQDGENVVAVEFERYDEVTAAGTENPKNEGWYEYDSVNNQYVLSTDTAVDLTKTYYAKVIYYKWDILGGVFDFSDRLQFGTEMPSSPVDGQTFLYLGEDTTNYDEVTPVGTENPSEEGWYEYDSVNDEYVLTSDITVESGKTYYTASEGFVKGVIYVYDETNGWEAQSSGDTFEPISIAQIDALFN